MSDFISDLFRLARDASVQTCPLFPGQLDDWDIPTEGQTYACEHVVIRSDGRTERRGFMWVHLTQSSMSIRGGFATLEAAELAAQELARATGASYVPTPNDGGIFL